MREDRLLLSGVLRPTRRRRGRRRLRVPLALAALGLAALGFAVLADPKPEKTDRLAAGSSSQIGSSFRHA